MPASARIRSEFESQLDVIEHEQKMDELNKLNTLHEEMEIETKLID